MKKTTRIEMSKHDIIDILLHAMSWLSITKIADPRGFAAELIGKSRRTIDAYIAPSEGRTIPPEDLHTICNETVRRVMTAHQRPVMPFEVYDTYEQPVARTTTLTGAIFLADLEDGFFEPTPGIWRGPGNDIAKPEVILRSQLRRVMRSGLVSTEQACSVLGCCPYSLIAYQLECPFRPLAPPEFGVKFLRAQVAEQIGEAA